MADITTIYNAVGTNMLHIISTTTVCKWGCTIGENKEKKIGGREEPFSGEKGSRLEM